MYNDCNFLTIF